jgi:hypothetical protein
MSGDEKHGLVEAQWEWLRACFSGRFYFGGAGCVDERTGFSSSSCLVCLVIDDSPNFPQRVAQRAQFD